MASPIALVFLCGVLLVPPLVTAKSFDFYFLVLMWPGSYCGQSACCRPTNGLPQKDFFIRGLWTYDSVSGKAVTKCSKTPWDINQISSLKDDLISYWSNIRCPSNNGASYWKNAWKTYGVCSGFDQTSYFQAALDLRTEVNLLYHLSHRGIVQSEFKQYRIDEIERAIAEGIGAKPVIRCSKEPYGSFQLYEVYICIDKDAKTVIECPVKPRFSCPSTVLFPPFDYDELIGSLTANPTEMPIFVE